MSRTYRRGFVQLDCNCGAPIKGRMTWNKNGFIDNNVELELQRSKTLGQPPSRDCNCGAKWDYYSKRNLKRDKKNWGKPPKWYKVMLKRLRKAKEKDALRNQQYDSIPHFRKEDRRMWD